MLNWIVRPSVQELGEEFCRRLLSTLSARRHAASARDLLTGEETLQARLAVALTGGSSARAFYQALAGQGSAWAPDSIDFFWSDERMVAAGDADSNFLLARQSLLDPCAVPEHRIHRVPTELPGEACAAAYVEQIRRQVPENSGGIPSFPLILLGLGSDGHTASLFPHTDLYAEDERLVRPAAGTAEHPHARMTFTPRLINSAEQVWFLITGAAKAEAVQRLFERSVEPEQTPALVVRPELTHITYFVDEGAARLILDRVDGARG